MSTKQIKKIVLAYSGGLDTTVILHWLKETYNAEVITFTADIGQDHNPDLVKKRANEIGASKVILEDLKEELEGEDLPLQAQIEFANAESSFSTSESGEDNEDISSA